MRPLYTLVMSLASGAAAAAGGWARLLGRRARAAEHAERRGFVPASPGGAGPVWVHAASVGEVGLAGRLVQGLEASALGRPVVLSCMTRTGRDLADRQDIGDRRFFLPLDAPAPVERAVSRVRPSLFVSVETELWPCLLETLAARGVPSAVVSGRISPRALARYRRVRRALAPALDALAAVAAASDAEAERFRTLGVAPERIVTLGNLKFDLEGEPEAPDEARARLRGLGLPPDRPVLVAASTGVGEEKRVLEAFAPLAARPDRPTLILAPRRPERFDEAARTAEAAGLPTARRSAGRAPEGTRILVLDTLGELASLLGTARGAFVGGTLVPVGGHNLIEPAARGVPVAFGPHTEHVEETAAALIREGAGVRVAGPRDLARVWGRWLDDGDDAEATGARGLAFVRRHRGATARTVSLIASLASGSGLESAR